MFTSSLSTLASGKRLGPARHEWDRAGDLSWLLEKMSLLSGVSSPDLDVHPSLFDRGLGYGTLEEGQQVDLEVTQGPEGLQERARPNFVVETPDPSAKPEDISE